MSRSPNHVESAANPRLKLARSLCSSRGVRKAGRYLLEGPRYIADAIHRGGIEYLVLAADATDLSRMTAGRAMAAGVSCIEVSRRLYDQVSDTDTAQGIAAVCALPEHTVDRLLQGRMVLALDGVSDPGNVGTAIRSAAALDADGVALLSGSASAFVPKATRASAGANAALPVMEGLEAEAFLRAAARAGFRLLLADAAGRPAGPDDAGSRTVLVVGSEAHGPSQASRSLADAVVSIPITDRIDSLNAAVSASLLLYALRPPRSG